MPLIYCPECIKKVSNISKKIDSFTHGMSYEEFVQDDKTVVLCIREIAVIGDGSIQLYWWYK